MPAPRLFDISQTLSAATPVWPGEPAVALSRFASIGPACPVNVGGYTAGLHAGTHADSPFHYSDDGLTSESCGLDPYIGACVLLDVRGARGLVRERDIDWTAVEGERRVLMRTYERFPERNWDSDFTAVDAAVVKRMASLGVRLIGTDAASLDPEQSKSLDAHQAVLSADMRILEGLVLDAPPPGRYELIALPLKIAGADASPVRAVLRELAHG